MRITLLLSLSLFAVLAVGCGHTNNATRELTAQEKVAADHYRQALMERKRGDHSKALEALEAARLKAWSPILDVEIARTLDALEREGQACRYWATLNSSVELERQVRSGRIGLDVVKEVGRRAGACSTAGMALPMPVSGPEDALVTIVEFTDFQCPYCKKVQTTLQKVMTEYPGQVRLVTLHLPLPFHKEAHPAARATIAAQRQGRFWEMREVMFERSRELASGNWGAWAEEAGLDVGRFLKDMDDAGAAAHVDRQMRIAGALGFTGTPMFMVNGQPLRGAQPFAKFKEAIDAAIVAAEKKLGEGVHREQLHSELTKDTGAYHDLLVLGKSPGEPVKAVKTVNPLPTRPVASPEKVWKVPVDADDEQRGPKDALVTIVEFTDFQCPFCGRVQTTLKQVRDTYGKDVRVVLKHNPLPFHKDAKAAATAAMAAGEQGKFWEMHDLLFTDTRALTMKDFTRYAEQLGLNGRKFATDFHKKQTIYMAAITADQALAARVEARGTPAFFVNGRKLTGAQPFAKFKALIDEELVKAKARIQKGTPRGKLYDEIMAGGTVKTDLANAQHVFSETGRMVLGPKKAAVVVTVFSDYQCPYCSRLDGEVQAVVGRLKGKVRVVFKHFPLAFHKQARGAALAALAAVKQRKGAKMHALLYAKARGLTDDGWEALAKEAGLNVKRFGKDVNSEAVKKTLEADMAEARAAGVAGTPSIYINGRRLKAGVRTTDGLVAVINAHLMK